MPTTGNREKKCDVTFTTEGSLINADGNSNENGKKARNLYLQNNNFARGSHFFVHFSVVVALPRHVKKEYVNTTQQFPFSF